MSQDFYQIARQSIQCNHNLLDALGKEESVRMTHHPEEDVIKKYLHYYQNSMKENL